MTQALEASEKPCPKCSADPPHIIGDGKGPHLARLTCVACGASWWLGKTKPGKRTDRNDEWRAWWENHYAGDLVCHWCMIRDSQTFTWFDIDHVIPLERGGPDELENTRPLCHDCHTQRHAMELLVRHVRGQSAREGAAT